MLEKVFVPTRPSHKRAFFLIGILATLYFLDVSSVVPLEIFKFLNPLLWLIVALTVWLLPREKFKGKLKLQTIINWWAFNLSFIYITVMVLAGLVDGFGRSPYDHSLRGMLINILTVGSLIIGQEFARSYIVNNLTERDNNLVFLPLALFMTFINLSLNSWDNLKGYEDFVKFAAQQFMPEFSRNLLMTYLVYLGGPVPAIIYMSVFQAFNWLSPILPNLKWITMALIGILTPVFSLMAMQYFYSAELREVSSRKPDGEGPVGWMVVSVISIGIIWFSVGVFPIYPSVIATGSMEPVIEPGDIILVKRQTDLNNIKIGDIIQFQSENVLISHRVIEIVEDKKTKSYRTKGDNNSGPDLDLVKPEQIKGKIIKIVPEAGWPTLMLKSKNKIPMDRIQF